MTRPRNERNLPSRVPDRHGRGHLSGGVGQDRLCVWVNASLLGLGITVEVDPDAAEEFADSMYARGRCGQRDASRFQAGREALPGDGLTVGTDVNGGHGGPTTCTHGSMSSGWPH